MTKIDELLNALENHELLLRGKQLRRLIEENPSYIETFNAILTMQKEIVRLEYATGVLQIEEKKRYELKLQELLDTPLISEYLLVIEELNDLVQTISNILSESLNRIDTE
ncbi:MAG: hypothetical protein CVV56_00015 [Tenericutes bacterium HGW-Tenericutes-1]|jgi:cell fate (sporulation/competence/biofilm development) regulator YmcA (YheA/YmcA/DUF963 family)|nr:MAG: hypothetical protein CVV56_00015 [Tenericutes bacterium HGW-Tenericutes-1]